MQVHQHSAFHSAATTSCSKNHHLFGVRLCVVKLWLAHQQGLDAVDAFQSYLDPDFLDRLEREQEHTPVNGQPQDLAARYSSLQELSSKLTTTLRSNEAFQNESAKLLTSLNSAAERTAELELIARDLLEEIGQTQDAEAVQPNLLHVQLPWFKQLHGKELNPHPDSVTLCNYLVAVRPLLWTRDETKALQKETKAELEKAKHYFAQARGMVVADIDHFWSIKEEASRINWDKVAAAPELKVHSANECRLRWLNIDHPRVNTSAWSKAEVEELHQVVTAHNASDWAAIADNLGTNRTPSACLRQFRKKMLNKKDWTSEEDEILREAISKFGTNWQSVARYVGRTSNQCINRWTKTLKPGIKRGRWTPEEDSVLRAAVEAVGTVWKKVGARVRGRTDQQCRERWSNALDPRLVKNKAWTPEEDEKLKKLVSEIGPKWSEISKLFGGTRTDNAILRRHEDITREPGAPRNRKRTRNADKGVSTTSRNKSLAQSGGRKPASRKKKGPSTEDEAEMSDGEEDQLIEENSAGPSTNISASPFQNEAEEGKARKKRKTVAAPTEEESDNGPPSDEEEGLDWDDRQKAAMSAPQTTRSGRKTKPLLADL